MNLLQVTMWPANRRHVPDPAGHSKTHVQRQTSTSAAPHSFVDLGDAVGQRLYWTNESAGWPESDHRTRQR